MTPRTMLEIIVISLTCYPLDCVFCLRPKNQKDCYKTNTGKTVRKTSHKAKDKSICRALHLCCNYISSILHSSFHIGHLLNVANITNTRNQDCRVEVTFPTTVFFYSVSEAHTKKDFNCLFLIWIQICSVSLPQHLPTKSCATACTLIQSSAPKFLKQQKWRYMELYICKLEPWH